MSDAAETTIQLSPPSRTAAPSGHRRWAWRSGHLRALGLLALFAVLLLAKFALVRFAVLADSNALQAALAEGPIVLVVLLVVDAFFADYRYRAFLALDAIVSAALVAITVYSAYYGQIPTLASLKNVGQALTVTDSIQTLVTWRQGILVADLVVLAAVGLAVSRRRGGSQADPGESAEESYYFQHRAVYAALLPVAALALVGFTAIREMPAPVDGLSAAKERGLLAYEAAMIVPRNTVAQPQVVKDPVMLQSTIERLRGGVPAGRLGGVPTGAARGKNVIVIQVEALQAAVIGAKVGGQEITPNLNRFVAGSWYFPNALSEVGRGTTSDAEFIANTSLYPAQDQPSVLEYVDRALPSLPRLLSTQGYGTMTFHANDVSYWNRKQLYAAMGFERYYDRAFFGDAEKMGFGASDRVLFAKTAAELEKVHANGRPFYAQVITLSSHHPFDSIPRVQDRSEASGTVRRHVHRSLPPGDPLHRRADRRVLGRSRGVGSARGQRGHGVRRPLRIEGRRRPGPGRRCTPRRCSAGTTRRSTA